MKKVISKLYQSLPSITNKLQVYYMHEFMVAIAEANCRVLCMYYANFPLTKTIDQYHVH